MAFAAPCPVMTVRWLAGTYRLIHRLFNAYKKRLEKTVNH